MADPELRCGTTPTSTKGKWRGEWPRHDESSLTPPGRGELEDSPTVATGLRLLAGPGSLAETRIATCL